MIVIFDTHPIQYRAPVFASMHRVHPDMKVYFFGEAFDDKKWWFHERGKIPEQKWDVELRAGYPNEVMNHRGSLRRFTHAAGQILTSKKPRAVVIYGYYLPEHWILWWLCRWHRVPLIFIGETFTSDGTRKRKLIKSFLQPLFFRGVSRFISIGEKSYEFYRRFRISSERIVRAKYCVDTSFFDLKVSDSQAAKKRVREQLKIPADAFVLLFVGRLFERKRPDDIMQMARALAPLKTVHVVMVGNGPLEADLKGQGEAMANVHLVGFKNQAETRDFYHAADILVVPSEYETWGLVVNEAFSARVPAIVTETCGVANELVVPGETGFIFPVGKWIKAVDVIYDLVENPKKSRELGDRAHAKVLGEYHIDQFARALLSACEG